MNTAEILKKVRKIEIHTTKLVNDMFGGEYQSVFKISAVFISMDSPEKDCNDF